MDHQLLYNVAVAGHTTGNFGGNKCKRARANPFRTALSSMAVQFLESALEKSD
jgi:hypothetical protein